MIKKLICLLLAFVTSVHILPVIAAEEEYTVKTLIYSEDFESYQKGTKPEMDIYESAGSIFVDTVGAAKVLHIKNINAISNATVEKEIDRVEKKTVDATVRFMQTQTGSSLNRVLELSDGDTKLTVYANAGALYLGDTKLCDYTANKWYTIDLNINLFSSTVNASVNGETKAEGVTSAIAGIDKISFAASQSPGFYIDDIRLESEQKMSEIHIDGVDTAVIPRNDENTYEFSAYIKDENGVEITVSDIEWSCSPADYAGVSSQTSAKGMTLTVTSTAAEGTVTVSASINDGAYTESKEIKLERVSAEDIIIDGAHRIAGTSGKSYKYGYDVVMNDQNGDAVDNYGEFTWSMEGVDGYVIPEFITLNSNTGIITVSGETPFREFIMLKATSVDDATVWTEKKILVTDRDSYVLDNYRYDAVKTHIDNALVYAQDPYDEDSPLLSDLINVHAKAPGATVLGNYESEISHNISAMSPLMRSLVNLSNFENDDSYRQKVYDIYKYNMEIAQDPTYMYEGGHMEVDLKTKTPNAYNMTKFNYVNETKGGYIYRVPMFEVDYDAAAVNTKANFVGHGGFNDETRWKNILVGRHWYVKTHSLTEETTEYYWNDTASYDWERKGCVLGASDCNFLVTYGEMFNLLSEYYTVAKTEEEKEKILEWGDILYSSLDQTGYDPITGEYTGMFNETNGSKHKADWSKIHDKWETNGRYWYLQDDAKSTAPGDRWFSNTILGDRDLRPVEEGGEGFGPSSDGKSWINMYYNEDPYKGVNEENWMHFLEPYMFTRENSCIIYTGPGLFKFLDALEDGSELKTKVLEKYTNAIYNYLNLRYDWEESHFKAMMSWGLDVTGWRIPHNGYYAKPGTQVNGKKPEAELVEMLALLVYNALELAETTDENEIASNTNPENKRKEQLTEQAHYIWSVLRNLCRMSFQMGDIGDPFTGEEPDLNFATTSTHTDLLQGMVRMYQCFGDEGYLKMAQNIANNIAATEFDAGAGVFAKEGAILTSTATRILPAFLLLEAVLLDDYDNLIEAEMYGHTKLFWDVYTVESEHGDIGRTFPIEDLPEITEASVEQQKLIIEDSFSMKVGESRQINYTVLPYDAGTGVLWDVSDPEIADISSGGVIKANKSGTVEIRCVSSSVRGLKSETITVTVE